MKSTGTVKTNKRTRRGTDEGRMTTAEISRLREQKRMHRHMVTGLIGLGIMAAGTALYFSPHAKASDETAIVKMSTKNLVDDVDIIGPTEEDIEAVVSDEDETKRPDSEFLAVSSEEAAKRAALITEADIPEEGKYNPESLLVNLASNTAPGVEDVNKVLDAAGVSLNVLFSEGDGEFGASFSVKVPEGTPIIDVYKKLLSDPRVESCGFDLYLEQEGVVSDEEFDLDGATEWSDGKKGDDQAFSMEQAKDLSVFDDPAETGGIDFNAPVTDNEKKMLSTQSEGNDGEDFHLQVVNDDEQSTNRWEYKHLEYEKVWNLARVRGRVTVAVIDNGFNIAHADLQNLIVNPVHIDAEGTTCTEGLTGNDYSGHGTHVAGIIAAQANNQFGISGLSYNAKIMPIQVESPADSPNMVTAAAVLRAFEVISTNQGSYNTVQRNNVRVVNISLGGAADDNLLNTFMTTLRQPMKQLNDSGTLVVVAAGNSSQENSPYLAVPSCWADENDRPENLLSVINLQPTADGGVERRPYSNYNMGLRQDHEISAPGTEILSTFTSTQYNTENPDESPTDNQTFASMSGTSQAAPIVASTAALMFAANPELTPQQVKERMLATATDLNSGPTAEPDYATANYANILRNKSFDAETGYGEVNPLRAVKAAKADAENDLDIGRENDPSLQSIELYVNEEEFSDFKYNQVAYNIDYKDIRSDIPDTSFAFINIPYGLTLRRLVGDSEISESMTASNGEKYREVSQVVTFIFMGKRAELNDDEAIRGIYAFYISYSVWENSSPALGEIGTAIMEMDLEPDLLDVVLKTSKGNELDAFSMQKPFVTQYLVVGVNDNDEVNGNPQLTDVPEGYEATVGVEKEGAYKLIATTDATDKFLAYRKGFSIAITNVAENQRIATYFATLYYAVPDSAIPASSSLSGMALKTSADKQMTDFVVTAPLATQYLFVASASEVDMPPQVTGLPEGYTATVTPDGEASDEPRTEEFIDDGNTSEPREMTHWRKYTVTVNGSQGESYQYPIVVGKVDDTEDTEASEAGNPGTEPDGPGGNNSSDAGNIGDLSGQSENPSAASVSLKQVKCTINNQEFTAFQYNKSSYIIYFKVGSALPPMPILTNLPQGWKQTSATSQDLPTSAKYPYGGKRHSLVVKNSTESQQYDFYYVFSNNSGSGTSSSTSSGTSSTTQGSATTSATNGAHQASTKTKGSGKAPVASSTSGTTNSGQGGTNVSTGSLTGQATTAVNAANNSQMPGTAPSQITQWSSPSTTSARSASGTNALNNLVSSGTLTQTGDAVVIVTGGIITVASVAGIVMARRRMTLAV